MQSYDTDKIIKFFFRLFKITKIFVSDLSLDKIKTFKQ